ncbi:MAG: hypothetical protein Q9195_007876 [Heterodermia aff. obscurata]
MDTKAECDESIQTDGINDNVGHNGASQLDSTGVLVKPKWRGTLQDKTDMDTLGRHQVLRENRQILFIGTNGGTADLFWGYIVVFIGSGLTYASLAEMASM